MKTPSPIHWNCKEFNRPGDLGLFEGRGAMLIHGVILIEGAMSPAHASSLELIRENIRGAFDSEWRMRIRSPLILGDDLDPEPDIAVVAGPLPGQKEHPVTAELIIEVADSSLGFDCNEKRLLYARTGIREYWVVDINGRRLLVFRDPVSGDYSTKKTFGPNDAVTPLAAARAVKVAEMLM